MRLNFTVETSQSSGATFRLVFGITVPLALVIAVMTVLGLS